jgi:hypothetical protein
MQAGWQEQINQPMQQRCAQVQGLYMAHLAHMATWKVMQEALRTPTRLLAPQQGAVGKPGCNSWGQ